jgi:hypothetical protein
VDELFAYASAQFTVNAVNRGERTEFRVYFHNGSSSTLLEVLIQGSTPTQRIVTCAAAEQVKINKMSVRGKY